MFQLRSVMAGASAALGRAGHAAAQLVAVLEAKLGRRWTPPVLAIGIWLLAVLLLTVVFGNPSPASTGYRFGALLLDRWGSTCPYPLTVQNLQHLVFAVGIGELWVAWRRGEAELAQLHQGYLPEDPQTMLQAEDLGPVRRKVIGQFDEDGGHLPAMIDLCVLQFFASRSVEQTLGVLGSARSLIEQRIPLRYRALRSLAWSIAALGAAASLGGLGMALAMGDTPARLLALGSAFDPGMVGVIETAALLGAIAIVQGREEHAVQQAGRYVLHNLINRVYTGRSTVSQE